MAASSSEQNMTSDLVDNAADAPPTIEAKASPGDKQAGHGTSVEATIAALQAQLQLAEASKAAQAKVRQPCYFAASIQSVCQ